jgi:hypothetical protein
MFRRFPAVPGSVFRRFFLRVPLFIFSGYRLLSTGYQNHSHSIVAGGLLEMS